MPSEKSKKQDTERILLFASGKCLFCSFGSRSFSGRCFGGRCFGGRCFSSSSFGGRCFGSGSFGSRCLGRGSLSSRSFSGFFSAAGSQSQRQQSSGKQGFFHFSNL
ncbi:Uncharacterised protein [Neisseria gonorrhoeae]|uniref:Uncharacterized protein n=1 Tax=Neisseria gonorrhoeae TaxID=485 RepID=A0A378VY56_NEIGO|nr:Uncharacterised protein [Neisseria gonorrhoeae]